MSGSEVFSGAVYGPGDWGTGGIDHVGVYGGGVAGTTTAVLTGTLTEAGDLLTAVIGGQTLTLRAYSDIASGVVFTTEDYATFYVFTRTPFSPSLLYPLSYTVAGNSGLACFLAGTRIATARGPVPIERLHLGDQVVLPRPRGRVAPVRAAQVAPVRWLGRRRILAAGRPGMWPVRIAAGAFAPGVPARDLFLSPDHAVFAGGGLIPVRHLRNGATVTVQPMARPEYWHVGLPRHALLLAEGLPAESYLDTGNRGSFVGHSARCGDGAAAARRIWARRGCAPLLLSAAAQAPVRRRLLARAAALGHATTDDPGLRLEADGAPVRLVREGAVWRAALPPGASSLRLLSRSVVPAQMLPGNVDHRRLGLAVIALTLDGEAVPPGDPRRAAGWHAPESGLQWTGGDGVLLCGATGRRTRVLAITAAPLLRYWRDAGTTPPGIPNAIALGYRP